MKYLDLLRTYRTEPLFTLEDLRGRFPHVKPQTLLFSWSPAVLTGLRFSGLRSGLVSPAPRSAFPGDRGDSGSSRYVSHARG